MKSRDEDHVVPLPRQAVEIINGVDMFADGPASCVFPTRRADKPLSDNTFSAMLAGMGYQDRHSAHGNRSTFSSIMNERDENPDVIELCLAHKLRNKEEKVRKVHSRTTRLDARRALLSFATLDVQSHPARTMPGR